MAEQSCTIGKNIIIRGNLSGAEDLSVEGRIEGAINLGNRLTIDPTGVVEAEVEVEDIEVNGKLKGTVHASRSIIIHASGMVNGILHAPRITIEDGAHFNGRVDMEVPLPQSVTV